MYTLIMYQYKTSSILGELPHTRQKSLLFSLPAGAMNAIISVSTFGGVRSAIGNVCMQYVHSTDSQKIGKNRKKGATLCLVHVKTHSVKGREWQSGHSLPCTCQNA